ncbi:hypothetical protein BUZ22_08245 [Staphylococcus haemolyticus]|uniref:Uncharacterized protein n=1 Tax=Staphylococcus haemolyticus TaxID=1283 RepID=A0A2K0A6T7_STAHA|nr:MULTISPECIES: hypothetical protein [Staphylococcus]PTF45041.1 hypothetical protein BUY18_10550 [Staphylococcus cohnii]MBE7341648.1 hypothetical protein [Staphylococcus haemolyticus]MCH4444427.1 hypothetical protein [Staphylococcus haemolyticus]MCH4453303.1 hypothetical protein [Staphylococcus haemolyticus]MDK8538544.1 hypothetical protein [Staphylococcus haemolyticus]
MVKDLKQIKASIETADISNKIQAVIDYVCAEQEGLEELRDYYRENNQVVGEKRTNDNMKSNFIIVSTLLSVIRDYESELNDIDIVIEKASSDMNSLATKSDNA